MKYVAAADGRDRMTPVTATRLTVDPAAHHPNVVAASHNIVSDTHAISNTSIAPKRKRIRTETSELTLASHVEDESHTTDRPSQPC